MYYETLLVVFLNKILKIVVIVVLGQILVTIETFLGRFVVRQNLPLYYSSFALPTTFYAG